MLHRGSEWKKWDLHVHTPASVLKNDFGSDWDEYVKTLFKKAIHEDVSVIGITDYFLLDGYKKLHTDYLDKPKKLKKLFTELEIKKIQKILILPNIEFRLQKIVGSSSDLSKLNRKLNYHVIFSDETSMEDIEQNFLNQLHFVYDAETGGKPETRSITRSNLIEFGAKLKLEHDDFQSYDDLFVGMMNASVCESQIADLLNKGLFKNKFLMGVNPDEDLSKVSWNSGGHGTRKTIIKQTHFVFSSNPGTIKFMSGARHASKDDFIAEFGDITPCLWGSDAHSFEELFSPAGNRHTWIKSDLSFKGLKQVVYDPESRVCIQELNPQTKNSYQTIRRVRFVDNRNVPDFSNEWIPVSPDLTTIIGGKSSGKSLLLHHIAKAINKKEVEEKCGISGSAMYQSFIKNPDFDFEVEWSNRDLSKLNDTNNAKPITYIPQLYINQLAEKDGKQHLNLLVKEILIQHAFFKKHLEETELKITEINLSISNNINALFLLREKYSLINKEISAIGIKESIAKESDSLKEKIKALREKSGFTEDEENSYKYLSNRLLSLENRKELLEDLQSYGSQITVSAIQKSNALADLLKRKILAEFQLPKGSKFVDSFFSELEENLVSAINDLEKYKNRRLKNIPKLFQIIEDEKGKKKADLAPLLLKIKDQEALNSLIKNLEIEEEKIRKILEKEKRLESLESQGKELNKVILDDYNKLIDCYLDLVGELEKSEYQLDSDISISAQVSFDTNKFDQFTNAFDRRGNIKELLGNLVNDSGRYNFNVENQLSIVTDIFAKVRNYKSLPIIRKGISQEEITKRLFADCFSIDYIVEYKGDEIIGMSPGKRGLVLLNLLLHLSNSTHPILIDQPEDNLDNRTIYDQLKDFVRQRKESRQILMVTHNANLVVSADSECVIVANQDGQNVGQDNLKYKFEYCSGAIENSFEQPSKKGLLNQKGIQQHVCEILEGGIKAFKEREMKYGLKH